MPLLLLSTAYVDFGLVPPVSLDIPNIEPLANEGNSVVSTGVTSLSINGYPVCTAVQ